MSTNSMVQFTAKDRYLAGFARTSRSSKRKDGKAVRAASMADVEVSSVSEQDGAYRLTYPNDGLASSGDDGGSHAVGRAYLHAAVGT